ncbi:DUF3131 domain-containing protein [Pseudoprimorskyibacter insulae]|uniref:DUF3131 domain-containing protein n=1 Tax=Pseudoprimorskyibacter insulae TaxID=1695997 RepID=A0A2R8B0M2_9RHOB|nr:DUF3131 domain-containing protein [Pseudoprimorskyibacter insulae]SPF81838.1 hypothetical protein PRI8871_03663 [Pseudoprimorskyibacter insulae]
MSFREGLIKARSHIVFVVALLCGLGLVIFLENLTNAPGVQDAEKEEQFQKERDMMAPFEALTPVPLAEPRAATADELEYAKIAWRYFENNTNPDTGLCNSADKYPSTTMWETGSYIIATISAERLGIITSDDAKGRLTKVITALTAQRLVEDAFPNKAYDTRSNEVVDYANKPVELGIGWSALDMARIIGTLDLVQLYHPEMAPQVRNLMGRWPLNRLVRDGELMGGNLADGAFRVDQEGRVGYEQYAAKAMMLFGFDMYRSYDASANLMVKEVQGVPIPVDNRLHRNITPAFATSEPYLFDGVEFGFDARSHRFASALFMAQEARYNETGILTAVTETHVKGAPYFVYSTIWGGGADWAVMSFPGERFDSKRTMATKAAFAWNALFATEYTQKLRDAIIPHVETERGFPEGLYESGQPNASVTANTNALVLASISYTVFGPLHRVGK